jgi:hypothetical protein
MTTLTPGQIALSIFGINPNASLSSALGSGFPGGSIPYYNYLAQNGAKLQTQSNNSPAVSREVQYFLSRVGVKTAAKATSLVKINANLSNSDALASSRTTTTTVYDSQGNKYTVTLQFFKQLNNNFSLSISSITAADGSKVTVNSTPQTITFDGNGNVNNVTGSFSLGTITLSNGATLAPKFSVSGGAPNGGLVTEKSGTFSVTSVQADGSPGETAGSNPIKSVDDLFRDQRLFTFLMTALGLSDQTQNVGLVKKALTQPLFNSKTGAPLSNTLVSQLNNTALTDAAQTLDLGDTGLKTLQSPIIINALIAGYQTNTFEQGIANQDPAVASARYFARNIGQAVSTASTNQNAIFSILGNATLRSVVTTALGFPLQLANLPVQDQANEIQSRLNVTQLKNPQFVSQFVTRYLTQVQAQNQLDDAGGPAASDIALGNLTALQSLTNFR